VGGKERGAVVEGGVVAGRRFDRGRDVRAKQPAGREPGEGGPEERTAGGKEHGGRVRRARGGSPVIFGQRPRAGKWNRRKSYAERLSSPAPLPEQRRGRPPGRPVGGPSSSAPAFRWSKKNPRTPAHAGRQGSTAEG